MLIRQLPLAWVRSQPQWPVCPEARHDPPPSPSTPLLPVAGGQVRLGKQDATYGWDNRIRRAPHRAGPFQASRMLVSNAEYLAFVQAGGYETRDWWDDEGWGWRQYAKARMPTFWVGDPSNPNNCICG